MTQISISCTTGGINIKIGNFNNFGSKQNFLLGEFLNFETLILVVMSDDDMLEGHIPQSLAFLRSSGRHSHFL